MTSASRETTRWMPGEDLVMRMRNRAAWATVIVRYCGRISYWARRRMELTSVAKDNAKSPWLDSKCV